MPAALNPPLTSYTLTVNAHQGSISGRILGTANLAIDITYPPQITLAAGQQFSANLRAEDPLIARVPPVAIGQVQYTSSDSSTPLRLSLSGENSNLFRIDQTGNLTLVIPPEPELPSYTLTVNVHQNLGAGKVLASTEIDINVIYRLVLTLVARQQFSVDLRTQTPPVTIGQIQYTSSDPSFVLGFSLGGANSGLFSINQDGNLVLPAAPSPQQESYTLTVNIHQDSSSGVILASTDYVQIELLSVLPPLDFSAAIQDTTAVGRRTILFAPISSDLSVYSSWNWDFGDSSAATTEMSPSHVYSVAGSYTVELSAVHSSGVRRTASHVVYPHDGADPLRFAQWYLNNPGDDPSPVIQRFNPTRPFAEGYMGSFEDTDGSGGVIALAGEDINLTDPIDRCGVLDTCRGEGVVVRVIDRAAQVSHPDLRANSSQNLSVNLHESPVDPVNPFSNYQLTSPSSAPDDQAVKKENMDFAHGTAVAGVILARDLNGIGIQGIAPRAELSSYNYLDNQSPMNLIRVFKDEGADVSNNSWGRNFEERADYQFFSSSAVIDAVRQAITQERGGLGTVFIKSAGNSGMSEDYSLYGNRHNSGAEPVNNLRYFMVIGSTSPAGQEIETSEAGANIRLNAYQNNRCNTLYDDGTTLANPINIVTTDIVGNFGFVYKNPPPLLILNDMMQVAEYTPLPSDILDYTYCFSGTSVATPMVAGAIALLLQKRPDLSWRDVQAILSLSARQNDSADLGWQVNGGGNPVHHAYGFGVLDIDEALSMAEAWQVQPTEVEYDSGVIPASQTIADCSTSCLPSRPAALAPPTNLQGGVSTMITVSPTTDIGFIEGVVVDLDIDFGTTTALDFSSCGFDGSITAVSSLNTVQISLEHRGSNGALISSSLLHKLHPTYTCLNLADLDWSFFSVQHFGEDIAGTWRVVVTDFYDDDATITLNGWQLRIYGHNSN